jgi:hypothetical protein
MGNQISWLQRGPCTRAAAAAVVVACGVSEHSHTSPPSRGWWDSLGAGKETPSNPKEAVATALAEGLKRISRHLSGSIYNPPSGISGFYFIFDISKGRLFYSSAF